MGYTMGKQSEENEVNLAIVCGCGRALHLRSRDTRVNQPSSRVVLSTLNESPGSKCTLLESNRLRFCVRHED